MPIAARLPRTVPPPRRRKPRSPDHFALGRAITELRERSGMTLEQLAEEAAMRFQLISELERGVSDPKLSTLLRMSAGLDIELSQLVARAEEIRREDPS